MPPAEIVLRLGEPRGEIRLSMLTPFHKHDPSPLLAALAPLTGVEIVLLDDGSGDAALIAKAHAALERTNIPARLIVWPYNRGRAAARNRLVAEARGEYVLFLDADMIPDTADFLARWRHLIHIKRPFIAFGGLSVRNVKPCAATSLHHYLFARSDCHRAAKRQRKTAHAVATSNLLVRRDVLEAAPFDTAFAGWGFEDVEWALRAAKHYPVLHIDNPATHSGLDTVDALLRKSAEAGPNYGRMARMHPLAVAELASYSAALVLKYVPGRPLVRHACAHLARLAEAPLPLRALALKTFRAAHYAEHLP